MKTLLITDLHIYDKNPDYLKDQIDCLERIVDEEQPDDIIVMGDVFTRRKPTPTELLEWDTFLDYCTTKIRGTTTVLRGNHDSEDRTDNGVTVLSLQNGERIEVVTGFTIDDTSRRAYIAHHESQDKILEYFEKIPKDYDVFGHFGYKGCFNSLGYTDSDIDPDVFICRRLFLGHIHKRSSIVNKHGTEIHILGTQYTTNFGEAGKDCFYAIIEDDELTFKPVTHGPRHLVIDEDSLEQGVMSYVNDTDHSNYIRLLVSGNKKPDILGLDRTYLDIRFKYEAEDDEIVHGGYYPKREMFRVNDSIIEDYLSEAATSIPKEDLLEGLQLIREYNPDNS